jgi:hypothetical protein
MQRLDGCGRSFTLTRLRRDSLINREITGKIGNPPLLWPSRTEFAFDFAGLAHSGRCGIREACLGFQGSVSWKQGREIGAAKDRVRDSDAGLLQPSMRAVPSNRGTPASSDPLIARKRLWRPARRSRRRDYWQPFPLEGFVPPTSCLETVRWQIVTRVRRSYNPDRLR